MRIANRHRKEEWRSDKERIARIVSDTDTVIGDHFELNEEGERSLAE